MNTQLYKQVHTLATALLAAAENEDDTTFNQLYQQLQALCDEHEGDEHKNHPVQWETLADFTEDSTAALLIYQKALAYAVVIKAKDYAASINYAMALLLRDEGDSEQALHLAEQASDYAVKIEDEELRREINTLLSSLK